MSINVGSLDRILRLIAGVVLIVLPFVAGFTSTGWTIVSMAVGLVMLVVATTRICPIYTIFGIRTCKS